MTESRVVRDFVEELLSNGKDANYIMMITNNTHWKTDPKDMQEVRQILKSFSVKLKKRFTEAERFSR